LHNFRLRQASFHQSSWLFQIVLGPLKINCSRKELWQDRLLSEFRLASFAKLLDNKLLLAKFFHVNEVCFQEESGYLSLPDQVEVLL